MLSPSPFRGSSAERRGAAGRRGEAESTPNRVFRPLFGLVLTALLAALPRPALAVVTDRLAVEQLAGESPDDAALAYEQACFRLGAQLGSAVPVQEFTHGGVKFVRLVVEGSPFALRCLAELGPERRGVDGTIEWFDGFKGGALVPPGAENDRVPDAQWYDPDRHPQVPPADPALVGRLASGDVEAVAELGKRNLPESLAIVDALAARRDARALAALELVAKGHPHWRVRRSAVAALDPAVSVATIAGLATEDPAWEVRLAVVDQLGVLAGSTGLPGLPADLAPEELLARLAREDRAWEVRRAAMWQLSSAAVSRNKELIASLARTDPEPRVRAAALEMLTGANVVDRAMLREALHDAAAPVRMAAVNALASAPEKADIGPLWDAANASERGVRVAAGGLFDHLDDPTIAPVVYTLYLREAEEVDADTAYLRTLAEFLARKPFPALADLVRARLTGPLAPAERRILACLHARLAPSEAASTLGPLLDAADPIARAVGAECAPDSPEAVTKRTALLSDESPDVRAAAVLGLCRVDHGASAEAVAQAEILPFGLGPEAMHVRQRCGKPDIVPARYATQLGAAGSEGDGPPAAAGRGTVPAMAGLALLLLSVVLSKILADRTPAPTPPKDAP